MKDLKKKLTAAGAMLVVSAVMLSGVSYAWFTLSTNPEVSNIKANIAANENLEIALDNGYAFGEGADNSVDAASKNTKVGGVQGSTTKDAYTWGNLVDLNAAMETLSTGKKLVLAPVKYDSAQLKYPVYGDDGRLSTVESLSTKVIENGKTGAIGGVKAFSKDQATYDAFSIDFWLRSNENCAVSLSDATKRAKSANDTSAAKSDVNGVEGLGSYIEIPISGENQVTQQDGSIASSIIDNYIKNLVVRFDVGDNSYYAKIGQGKVSTINGENKVKYGLTLVDKLNTDANAKATSINLSANVGKKVTMYVYIDGETITNKEALLDDVEGMTMNIQFSSSEIDGNGETPGAMNGATVAPTSTGAGN